MDGIPDILVEDDPLEDTLEPADDPHGQSSGESLLPRINLSRRGFLWASALTTVMTLLGDRSLSGAKPAKASASPETDSAETAEKSPPEDSSIIEVIDLDDNQGSDGYVFKELEISQREVLLIDPNQTGASGSTVTGETPEPHPNRTPRPIIRRNDPRAKASLREQLSTARLRRNTSHGEATASSVATGQHNAYLPLVSGSVVEDEPKPSMELYNTFKEIYPNLVTMGFTYYKKG